MTMHDSGIVQHTVVKCIQRELNLNFYFNAFLLLTDVKYQQHHVTHELYGSLFIRNDGVMSSLSLQNVMRQVCWLYDKRLKMVSLRIVGENHDLISELKQNKTKNMILFITRIMWSYGSV